MKWIVSALMSGLLIFISGTLTVSAHELSLSSMKVSITSRGQTATFHLYDTQAAKEFYQQLPLRLELSNFRDAQWMFYPPEKLTVTSGEAYHDGEKRRIELLRSVGRRIHAL
jgi:hypothetical protein